MVFQQRLHNHWRDCFIVSHLSYTNRIEHQYQVVVKVPGGSFFVLPRVTSIFTRNAISPSLWLRQLRSRYAIRAGRNLPDKEFRYLRMVIVTTAVYWGGLNSPLHPPEGLTGPLNLPAPGRRQSVYIVLRLRTDLCFLVNSRFSLVCATPLPLPTAKVLTVWGGSPLLPKLRGGQFCRVP